MRTPSNGADFHPGPLADQFFVVLHLVARQAVGLGAHGVDFFLRHPPALQGSYGPRHGDLVGFDLPLGVAEHPVGDRAVGGRLVDAGQTFLVDAKLREVVDQVALLFAQVAAPDHRQQLAFADPLAEAHRRVALPGAQFDDLAGEAGANVREAVGIQHERPGQLEHHGSRRALNPLGSDSQFGRDVPRQANRVLVADELDGRGRPLIVRLLVCRGRQVADDCRRREPHPRSLRRGPRESSCSAELGEFASSQEIYNSGPYRSQIIGKSGTTDTTEPGNEWFIPAELKGIQATGRRQRNRLN